MTTYTDYTPKPIDAAYVNTLVDFINACRKHHVKLDTVQHFQNGWRITFVDCKGDAICHDGSYGSPNYAPDFYPESTNQNDWSDFSGAWETIGFPWDSGDVSVHEGEELATMIADYQRGEYHEEDWE